MHTDVCFKNITAWQACEQQNKIVRHSQRMHRFCFCACHMFEDHCHTMRKSPLPMLLAIICIAIKNACLAFSPVHLQSIRTRHWSNNISVRDARGPLLIHGNDNSVGAQCDCRMTERCKQPGVSHRKMAHQLQNLPGRSKWKCCL